MDIDAKITRIKEVIAKRETPGTSRRYGTGTAFAEMLELRQVIGRVRALRNN